MKVELLARPANTAARVTLSPGEECVAEGGAMIAMSADTRVETHVSRGRKGAVGVLRGLARTLAGEGIFLNHFTAGGTGGEVYLSTTLPGDMEVIEIAADRSIHVQNGSFVAHESNVDLTIAWGGMKNVFSGEGLIWLSMTGPGKVVVSAFGSLYAVDVEGEYIVDTGNIVAYEDSLQFRIGKAGRSWVSSVAGGEGLVCRFSGSGKVWCQSHADKQFGAKLTPYLLPKKG